LGFKFLRRSVGEKHLMRFQSETSVFKFLRRSVIGALVPTYKITSLLVIGDASRPTALHGLVISFCRVKQSVFP